MKGLIYKDLCITMHSMKHILIIAPILLFLVMTVVALGPGAEPIHYIIPVILCMIVSIIAILLPCGYDERSNWLKAAVTMTVTRLNCYHARLLIQLIWTGMTGVLGIATALLSALVYGDFSLAVVQVVLIAAGGMTLLSIIIGICSNALIIRLGAQKAGIIFWCFWMFFTLLMTYEGLRTHLAECSEETLYLFVGVIVMGLLGTTLLMYFLGRKWIQMKEL